MRRKIRRRKQRVVMRTRQKTVLKSRLQPLLRAGFFAALLGLAGTLVFRNNSWATRYIGQHIPTVVFHAPETLAELPLLKEILAPSFALWLPGAETRLRRNWLARFPAIEAVHFEKSFFDNRIVARLEPRIPLVRLAEGGLDKDGVVFTLGSERWLTLPKAVLSPSTSRPVVGRWLAEISRVPEVWSQVVAVSEDSRGEIWLDMTTGTHVAWGVPATERAQEKARGLALVLEDAHNRLSGAATADVRFFEEGRVIIKPKKAA